MKYFFMLLTILSSVLFNAQKNALPKKTAAVTKLNPNFIKVNDSVADLIPQKMAGKFGFINQAGKIIIKHEYSNVGFFARDCNLQNSPNKKVQQFGSDQYASVRLNGSDYRINKAGKRVYHFKESDLGKCAPEYKAQLFHAYIMNGAYGIIEDSKFENPGDYRQFTIYPQYDYLHIMEGDDLHNPMIIASYRNRFGVIDIHNKVIIPFEYSDIKRNFSWKLARLFEVTKDGINYFYVDGNNHGY
ncbi:WG repeat-containing protein [Kaistella palustris]|uniref:WG repeat-containing protein n=1 Tax=Kaistella palustris TaxID=493376 RepID=UPI000421581A|nr:WG repeat-containing protein [Kaistella palustris]